MFIDGLNCYYIHNGDTNPLNGLYVFYPELNKIYFYQEKDAKKTYNYENISIIQDTDGIYKILVVKSGIFKDKLYLYS